MSERPESTEPNPEIRADELNWVAANLPRVRRWTSGRLFLYEALALAFVVGLAAHVVGYELGVSAVGEPAGLLADLLANLGIALWTGGVLVVFVQILPEIRRRSAAHRLEQYEAALREQGRLPDDGRQPDEAASQDEGR